MDAMTLLIATLLLTLVGLASVARGVDSRDGFRADAGRSGVLR